MQKIWRFCRKQAIIIILANLEVSQIARKEDKKLNSNHASVRLEYIEVSFYMYL